MITLRPQHLVIGALIASIGAVAPLSSQQPSALLDARGTQALRDELPRLDSGQLIRDLYALSADSMEGRGIGTRGSTRARNWLIARAGLIGLTPLGASASVPFRAAGGGGAAVSGTNLLWVIRGTSAPDRYLVLSAHYDHLGVRANRVYPGADDNASGVVTVLAIAKWFKDNPPANSVIIALFDGEESGMLGSTAFVNSAVVPPTSIIANVNLDMVARNVKGALYAAGTAKHREFRSVIDAAGAVAPVKLLLGHDDGTGQGNWNGLSDHAAFNAKNIPWLYLGVEDHPDYHKPTDVASKVEPGFFFRCATTIAELVRMIDAAPPTTMAERQ